MVRPRRQTPIDLAAEIKAVARRRLAEQGTAGLSLRAIARELNITAPAIYNYFPRLENLLTALIVDAFTALGDALAAGRDTQPAEAHANRLRAIGLAYRSWACANPEQYNLIFGTPIPGYHAPLEVTQPAAERGLRILIGVLEDAWQAGKIRLDTISLDTSPVLLSQIQHWQQFANSQAHPAVYYLAVVVWARVHGLVSLELYRQYPISFQDPGEIFRLEIERIQTEIGLHP